MGKTLFQFKSFYGLLVCCLLVASGCEKEDAGKPRYLLRMANYERVEVDRPGTTGVKIMPPRRKPREFKFERGTQISHTDLLKWGPERVIVDFDIPVFPGPVRNIVVQGLDSGEEKYVKARVSGWTYTPFKSGHMKLIIYPLDRRVDVFSKDLESNYNGEPKVGVLHNVH